MHWILVLPIIIPFSTAVAALLFRNNPRFQFTLNITGAVTHLFACTTLFFAVQHNGILSVQIGNWPSPFGIPLVADHLSTIMVAVTGILSTAVVIYAKTDIGSSRSGVDFYPLVQIMIGGVCGSFLTGDLFNLYVWFEVMLMASFGLLVLAQEKRQLDGGVKYVAINLLSTLLFITGLGLLYGLTGTLNMADLHGKIQAVDHKGLVTAISVIFLMAFGIKSGLFPLFFWLPASYHTPPVAISAIFAGLLTKVGVYAVIRTFTLIFTTNIDYTHSLILLMAATTMVIGVLGAAAHHEFRRILSFHIISQVGYMVTGLALFTKLALAGSVFYLFHHMIVKANLFLVSGIAYRMGNSFALSRLGGLYRSTGLVSILFFIPAFSLAGLPPLSGFWAKMIIIKASLETDQFIIAIIASLVGLLTLYSMTKIWAEAFWKPKPDDAQPSVDHRKLGRPSIWLIIPSAGLCALTILIGLAVEPLFQLSLRAAEELLHPANYVKAVLR